MIKLVSRVSLVASAAMLAIIPVAVQANTRAAGSSACYTCGSSSTRVAIGGDDGSEKFNLAGGNAAALFLSVAATAAAVGAIVVAVRQGNQSPGT